MTDRVYHVHYIKDGVDNVDIIKSEAIPSINDGALVFFSYGVIFNAYAKGSWSNFSRVWKQI